MSTKPTTAQLPTWDTNLTNVIAILSNHKTDGFINGYQPTAGEMNTVLAFIYLWCKYVSDGDLSGNLTASSLLEGTNLALLQMRDYKNQYRAGFDHFGYPSGNFSQWDEHWRGTTAPQGWTFTATGTATAATITDPTSTFQQRYVTLQSGTTAGSSIICTPEYVGFMDTSSEIVEEFMVETVTVAGAANTNFFFGIQFSGNAGTDLVYFGGFGGVANWQAYTVVNGVLTNTDTGITFAANTKYRMRIECIGSSNNSVATFQYRYYINGVLVATRTSTIAAGKFRPYFKSSSASAGSDPVHIGRIRMMFNHVLASDNN